MAIIEAKKERGFRAGHFLVSEECTRQTYSIDIKQAKDLGDGSYLFASGDMVYGPRDGSTYIVGICYEDVVFVPTDIEQKCTLSVVSKGTVDFDLITYKGTPIKGSQSESEYKTALTSMGIVFGVNANPDVTRPFTED